MDKTKRLVDDELPSGSTDPMTNGTGLQKDGSKSPECKNASELCGSKSSLSSSSADDPKSRECREEPMEYDKEGNETMLNEDKHNLSSSNNGFSVSEIPPADKTQRESEGLELKEKDAKVESQVTNETFFTDEKGQDDSEGAMGESADENSAFKETNECHSTTGDASCSKASENPEETSARKELFPDQPVASLDTEGGGENSASNAEIRVEEASDGLSLKKPSDIEPSKEEGDGENKKEDPGTKNVNETNENGAGMDDSHKLLVFAQDDLKSAEKDEIPNTSPSPEQSTDKNSNGDKNSLYTQPIFEDITEDEESDEECYENIELELDDLIDANEACKNNGGVKKGKGEDQSSPKLVSVKQDIDEKSSPMGNGELETTEQESHLLENPNSLSSSENHDPSSNLQNGPDKNVDFKLSTGSEPKRKKFTARKSGKPINQLEGAPLKRINMHPIKNVTMNLSEVQDALDFDPLKDLGKKFKKNDHSVAEFSSESGQGNTYRVVSITKSNSNLKKKRFRKNTYDFPGCKKRKKGRFSDDVTSSGASSVESISLSDGDLGDLEAKESNMPFSESSSASSNPDPTSIKNSCSNSSPNVPSSMVSPSSSPSSSHSNQVASNQGKSSSSKGSNKMKTVLEMLHERNRQKAAQEGNKGPITSTTTTTTTTIMVSPPPNKPLIEGLGVKRKGTPRKRKEDVICVSDDEDDEEILKPKAKEGKRSLGVTDTTTVTSSVAAKVPKSSATVTQAPVVMMVAQHSTPPGLRSLLPRNVVVSPGKVSPGGTTKAAQGTNILTSIPIVSTLPVGVKTVSMPGLPGVTALPLTSLPPGSTLFTAVQAGPGASPIATAIPGASLLNIAPLSKGSKPLPSAAMGVSAATKGQKHLKNIAAASVSAIPISSALPVVAQKLAPSNQVSSDALRALLVGKPYALAQVTPATSCSVSNSQVVFQMLTKTSSANVSLAATATTTLVPLPTQPLVMSTSKAAVTNSKAAVPLAAAAVCSSNGKSAVTSNRTTYSLIKPHNASLPNGVSCLTPPKTPDMDSVSEVAVAASLSRPVAGQCDDHDVIPLCCCKINIPSFNKMLTAVTYCQALDSVDNKVLGCCNKVTNAQLARPGVKIPFMAICEAHRKRLKLHQCCPGCGHFCSQGKFQQCKKEGKSSTHLFHKQCMFYRGAKYFCPHCGEETSQCEVDLKLDTDETVSLGRVPSRVAKKDLERKTVARMGLGKLKRRRSASEPNQELLTLPNKKAINSDAIPQGPDQATLTRLCRCATEDRPKKYRTLPKDLFNPALEGDMEKVFYLLADGMDPNMRCDEFEDQTPLHAAATSGSLGTVFILEQYGAEMHAQDRNLRTPMMCAAEKGHLSVVQFLLKAGAKIEDRGEDGMTSLHYAAKAGHIDIIQMILETQNLDINVQDDGGWTPIIWATESMLHDVVRYLISQGGDPNKKDNEENTGLHWAAFSGSNEIAEMFLDMGCELDTPNEHGDRPLHIAARQDHYSIIVLLLARGADVDLKNNKEETPMDCCLNKTGQVWMALKVNHQLRGFAARKLIQPERLLDRDITMGREKNPIACVNKEDTDACPTDYLYINENVETSPLNINCVITSLQSCRCKDDCASMYCVCGRSSIKCWYDKMGRLVEDFNFIEPPHIFECNRACRCWVNCNNRVVQNGIVCRLQLFRTDGRGWGVRTLMDIPKGTFVCEYIGELISDSEADRREDDSYLFDLDNKDGDTYCIDARKYGNIARFINHLCEPNLIPVKVFVEHQDLRFPRICFFSSRDMKAYEELGFDYGEKFWIIKWKDVTCDCKSTKCKYSKDTIQKTLDDYKLKYPDEPMQDS